ncbi:MAG: phosphodiester glycosidase family protein [Fimbriimonadaceae bacterium]|nr:phosphodiester glycosidase family protein [Fimbriimonadaceae bacterium]
MRRLIALLVLAAPLAAIAQVRTWEKPIGPGLTYRAVVDFEKPLMIHALRWTPGAETFVLKPENGGGQVYGDSPPTKGREAMIPMVTRTTAVAGVNADFFPFTGDPLGLMLRDRELVSLPFPNRSFLAWGRSGAAIGRAGHDLKAASGSTVWNITGLNQEAADNALVLNTPAAGEAWLKDGGVHVVLEAPSARVTAANDITARVARVVRDGRPMKVEGGTLVLSGSGTSAAALAGLKAGDSVRITGGITGFDLGGHEQAVGGGPLILEKGEAKIEVASEGFDAPFSTTRHPRTAVGVTPSGDLWLVVVDGRQAGVSRGVSLAELVDVMKELGCTDALNLDGGGSSEMVLGGISLNRPSSAGNESRPVANGILLFDLVQEAPVRRDLVIQGRPTIEPGVFSRFRVLDGQGREIPNVEVIWSCIGAAWVDQGGFVRGLPAGGEATLRAWVSGNLVEVKLTVTPAPTPPR